MLYLAYVATYIASYHAYILRISALSVSCLSAIEQYKMKSWHKIYFGGLANYENPPN